MAALYGSAFAVDSLSRQVIGGNISGFLKKDKSPYQVNETLVVSEGRALVIEAGVEIFFNEGTGLDVRGGNLAIMGEHSNPVLLSPAKEGSTWNGISITGLKRSEVQGVLLKDADFEVRETAVLNPNAPLSKVYELLEDDREEVREAAKSRIESDKR